MVDHGVAYYLGHVRLDGGAEVVEANFLLGVRFGQVDVLIAVDELEVGPVDVISAFFGSLRR